MDQELLNRYSKMIEEELKTDFYPLKRAAMSYHPFIGQVYSVLEEFVLRGGQRLAASSTLLVYQGYRGTIDETALKVASGIDIYRHSILVHDDIVDREELRRGAPTIHRILGVEDPELGTGSALFAGNILYALAQNTISNSGLPGALVQEILFRLSSDYVQVNESQILDLAFQFTKPGIEEWEVMASRRAASLFRVSMLAGAIMAGAGQRERELLEKASQHIGLAFDIQDDIIDTFATREQYGRDPCGDICKGKKPLHIVIALSREDRLSSIIKRWSLPEVVGAGGAAFPEEMVREVQEIIRGCGALEDAKSISREHAHAAQDLIKATSMGAEVKQFFISFIKFVEDSLDWYR